MAVNHGILHAGLDQRTRGSGCDRLARTYLLQTLRDHLVTGRQPADDSGDGRGRLPELNPALLGLVVGPDGEDIVALLIGQYGGARDRQHLDRLHALQQHRNKFAIGQLAHRGPGRGRVIQRRIGDGAAQRDGVGILRDGVVDEVQLTGLAIKPAVRQANLDHHRLEAAPGRVALPQFQRLAYRNREGDIHRVLADDGGERPRTGVDDVAFGDRGATDLAVDRRVDFGIIEIDL